MRILVTGGAGFIGSHTVDALLREGYGIRILDALKSPVHVEGCIPDYLPLKKVEFIQGDVRDRLAWERSLEGIDAVFHFAVYQDYLPCFSKFFHTNAVSTALLYELIVEKSLPVKKVIIASSQAAYGEGKYLCMTCSDNGAVYPDARLGQQLQEGQWEIFCPACRRPMQPQWTDESVVNPHNQYAISKRSQELIALNLGVRYDIPTVCLRYSIVQGPRQSFRNAYSGLLRIFAQRILNGKRPVCYEDGRQLRDYVSVFDVVRANLLVLEDDKVEFDVFNVGGNRQVTVLDYARLIARQCDKDVEPEVPGLYRFGDTRHIFSDVSKLRALGWEPVVPLEAIIEEYIVWAQAQSDFRDYYTEAERVMRQRGAVRNVRVQRGSRQGAAGPRQGVSGCF